MPARLPVESNNHITFIHAADLQLGKPFSSIADDSKRARVQQERFESVRRIGALVRERQARFVIVAGDVFDSPTPSHATVSAALNAFATIGVPIYAIPGNHDHAGPDSVWETGFFRRERELLAPNFHILETATVTVVDLGIHGTRPDSVILLPCPLLRRHHADDPTAWIRGIEFSEIGNGPRIVIAHGSAAAFSGHFRIDEDGDAARPTNTIAIERLPLDECDYVALGDWHGVTAVGPKAWYSGTPEIDRFPKTGQEPGHVLCVRVGRGVPPQVTPCRTGRLRWLSHTIALDAVTEPGAEASPDMGRGTNVIAGAHAVADSAAVAHGPAYLDEWLTQATQPEVDGQPGFEGSLARITIIGTVSLAGRQELDRIIESWGARLLRLDLVDAVSMSPTVDEIHELAARPNDPIISRVAAELVQRLEAGGPQAQIDLIRHSIHMLHALTNLGAAHRRDDSQLPALAVCGGSAATTAPPRSVSQL